MTDYNLDKLWQSENQKATAHFQDVQEDLKKSYTKKSGLELTRIKNLFWWELLQFGLFTALILAVLFIKPGFFGIGNEETQVVDIILFISYSLFYIGLCVIIYRKLVENLRRVAVLDVLSSLENYLNILKKNRALLTRMSVATMFVFYSGHLIMQIINTDFDWISMIFNLVISLPFSYFVIQEYFEYLYKPSETEIQILINQFQNE